MANTERSLADEAGGPVAQLLPVPQDEGDDSEDDPLAMLRKDIRDARGKALLVETVASGWGEGKTAAPQSDWQQRRLGPQPTEAMVKLADAAFARVLAASGCSPALFDDSDGTSKREALRQWHLGTVRPLARLLETELSEKLTRRSSWASICITWTLRVAPRHSKNWSRAVWVWMRRLSRRGCWRMVTEEPDDLE